MATLINIVSSHEKLLFMNNVYDFLPIGVTAKPVGWTRIPIFQHDIASRTQTPQSFFDVTWILQSGDSTHSLHPGDIPETLVSIVPRTPLQTTAQKKSKKWALIITMGNQLITYLLEQSI